MLMIYRVNAYLYEPHEKALLRRCRLRSAWILDLADAMSKMPVKIGLQANVAGAELKTAGELNNSHWSAQVFLRLLAG